MTTSAILALVTGLPVIATKHSGFPDQVVPGKNGYLANEADPKDFADKMLEYISHPEGWGAMSDFGRAHMLAKYDQKILIDRQLALYRHFVPGANKIAFVVGVFPAVSETWLISQVTDLIDRGVDVELYVFRNGGRENISDKFFSYKLEERMHSAEMPLNRFTRVLYAVPKILHVLLTRPSVLPKIFNIKKYGADAYSLKNLFWVEPFLGMDAEVVHCHFGTVALRYLRVREILGLPQPFLTTFYGLDVSGVFKEKGPNVYKALIRECAQFLVMSNNMKERILPYGFSPEKVEVLPISVDVGSYPFSRRSIASGETVRIVTVGRFVEKKGYDDLLSALAMLKKTSPRPFVCSIIGGGELDDELHKLAQDLGVEDVVEWKGFMKVEDVVQFLTTQHLYVQPSKTAKDGDME